MTPRLTGGLAMVGACVLWGLSPIFYKALGHVPAAEVLAHRTIWSAVLFGFILGIRGRLGALAGLTRGAGTFGLVAIASAMIAVNWFLFIYAVQAGHVVETSLGYFVFPLVSVAFGALIFRERASLAQVLAVLLAALGVGTLVFGLGQTPWISLTLAVSFALYGVAKKVLAAEAMVSVTMEVLILLPLAILWLVVVVDGWGAFAGLDALLLIATGPITATPLILFTMASRRLSMASVGLIGYLNPTLQFLCATLLFGERFTVWHGIAFGAIWTALAIYSAEALRGRRPARAAPTGG